MLLEKSNRFLFISRISMWLTGNAPFWFSSRWAAGNGLGLPVRGSIYWRTRNLSSIISMICLTHVVRLLIWSIKKARSCSVRDCCQPGGNGPSSSVTLVAAVVVLRDPVKDAVWEWLESPSSIWCRLLTCGWGRWAVVLENQFFSNEKTIVCEIFTFDHWVDPMLFDEYYDRHNKFDHDYPFVLFETKRIVRIHSKWRSLTFPARW